MHPDWSDFVERLRNFGNHICGSFDAYRKTRMNVARQLSAPSSSVFLNCF
jgi:hypothetical protein